MTTGATRPSPCLRLSRPRDNSEETVTADSRKLQSYRLKAPLKLRIRFNRRAVRDEKGNARRRSKEGADFGSAAALGVPLKRTLNGTVWDNFRCPQPVGDSDELLTLARHEQLSHTESGTINSCSKLMFLYS